MAKSLRLERRKIRDRQKRYRSIVFIAIVVVVFGIAGYFLKQSLFRPPPPAMAGNVIDVKADMSGFDKKEIDLKVGEPVTLRLTSMDNSGHTDGGGKHQLAVDELSLNIIAEPMKSSYVTFTPTQAGTYTFYCDICCGGRANPTMNGKIVVQG